MKVDRRHSVRTCMECSIEYDALLPSSRFCSSRCRSAYWRSSQRSETQERAHANASNGVPNAEIDHRQLEETEEHLDDHVPQSLSTQFAVELLTAEAERWRERYERERIEREDCEDEIDEYRLKLELARDEMANLKRLNAIEILKRKQPDTVTRLFSSPLADVIVPIVAKITGTSTTLSPNSLGQVPQSAETFFSWILSLPVEIRENLLSTLSELPTIRGDLLAGVVNIVRESIKGAKREFVPP